MARLDAWMRELLTETPAHTAVLATVRADGRAHAKPIWFALDSEDVVFNTGEDTVAGRNLARDPRVTLCVEVETPPYSFLILEGTATLVTHAEDADALHTWAGRIGARYLGAGQEQTLADRNGVPGEYLVRVAVGHATGARNAAE